MSNQTKALKPIERLKNALSAESVEAQFKNALKENSSAFVASLIDLYGSESSLQACNPMDVIKEALKAAVLKLPINKSLGFAYIVAFNNGYKKPDGTWGKKMMPTFMPGYKGYIQMAIRTQEYKFINADVVYEGEYKSQNKLTGEFDFSGEKASDKIVGYFAYFELRNGFSKTLYMPKEKVTAHAKKYSKSYGSSKSPWVSNFDEMALKTVIRGLLSRYGYLSTEMITAIANDIETDTVAQGVEQEIDMNANKQSISFEDAEEVVEDKEPESAPKESKEEIPDIFK